MIRTIIFLLITTAAFGQSKTRQVDEALGTRIREIPQAGELLSTFLRLAEKTSLTTGKATGQVNTRLATPAN
jgi:hypothetical protein